MIGLEFDVIQVKEPHPAWNKLVKKAINQLKAFLKKRVLDAK